MADKVLHLNDENFADTIAKEEIVLIDFYADWCGPCRMMTPIINQLAEEMDGKVAVAKVDIDASQKVTQQYEITSIPTILVVKKGKEEERVVGVKDLAGLKELLNPLLA